MIAAPAAALDLFTLWRQPMIPLQVMVGDWADYHTTRLRGGQRQEEIIRIQCVGEITGTSGKSWLIELLPLRELTGGQLAPLPGQGLQLRLSARLLRRQGQLADLVERVVQWQDGQSSSLPSEQWRDDPLIAASLRSEFDPQAVELVGSSIRVVAGQHLDCDHFELTAADTQRVELPSGQLEQMSLWEISAAINNQVPFFGIAFVSERTKSQSRLDPPSDRFEPPPPSVAVETMELVGYGQGAKSVLEAP